MVKCVIVHQVYFAMGTRHTGSYYIMAIVTPKELLNVVGDVMLYHVDNVKKIAAKEVRIMRTVPRNIELIVMIQIDVQEMVATQITSQMGVTRLIVILAICKFDVHHLILKPCLSIMRNASAVLCLTKKHVVRDTDTLMTAHVNYVQQASIVK